MWSLELHSSLRSDFGSDYLSAVRELVDLCTLAKQCRDLPIRVYISVQRAERHSAVADSYIYVGPRRFLKLGNEAMPTAEAELR
jgi:hypothetical protein